MLTEHAAPFNPAFDSAARRAAICERTRMIRKSGYRFSAKDHAQLNKEPA
jgi:hypothetical protein